MCVCFFFRRYAFSCYKAFGPHLAVLYGRRAAFDAVRKHAPNHPFVDPENHGPARWELGTMNQVGRIYLHPHLCVQIYI